MCARDSTFTRLDELGRFPSPVLAAAEAFASLATGLFAAKSGYRLLPAYEPERDWCVRARACLCSPAPFVSWALKKKSHNLLAMTHYAPYGMITV